VAFCDLLADFVVFMRFLTYPLSTDMIPVAKDFFLAIATKQFFFSHNFFLATIFFSYNKNKVLVPRKTLFVPRKTILVLR